MSWSRWSALLATLAALALAAGAGGPGALSACALGCALAWGARWALVGGLRTVLARPGATTRARVVTLLAFLLRHLVLGGILYLAVVAWRMPPAWLGAGLTVLPACFLAAGVAAASRGDRFSRA